MTLEQSWLVQASFQKVLLTRKASARIFYNRLLELDPDLRPLFKPDMQQQEEKFISMLEWVVDGLNQFDAVLSELRELGKRHVDYGVLPAHYDTVREALLWMLGRALGPGFTEETRQAWVEMYDLLCQAMLELPSEPGSPA